MRNLAIGALAVLGLLGTGQLAVGEPAGDPRGIWLTEAGDAKVKVSKCGDALCAVIVWLKDPIDSATGKPQLDDKNPNPALARRPVIGISLFSHMRADGDHWSGKIYDADNGKTYASEVAMVDVKTLKVSGCVMFICGSEKWSRVGQHEQVAER